MAAVAVAAGGSTAVSLTRAGRRGKVHGHGWALPWGGGGGAQTVLFGFGLHIKRSQRRNGRNVGTTTEAVGDAETYHI